MMRSSSAAVQAWPAAFMSRWSIILSTCKASVGTQEKMCLKGTLQGARDSSCNDCLLDPLQAGLQEQGHIYQGQQDWYLHQEPNGGSQCLW